MTGRGAVAALGALLLTAACAGAPPPTARPEVTAARADGWTPLALPAGPFTLFALARDDGDPGAPPRVYIEGDGIAWVSRTRPSRNPTPDDPVGLRLALADPDPGRRLYLARPCQFLEAGEANACAAPHWTSHRFSDAVVEAYADLLHRWAQANRARSMTLIGYSGGGVLATLIAARLPAVGAVVTVAAPVDHALWTRHHGVRPLTGSRDPLADAAALRKVPQVHLAGRDDRVVPPDLNRRYLGRVAGDGRAVAVTVDGADHRCCWAARWPALWASVKDQLSTLPPRDQ